MRLRYAGFCELGMKREVNQDTIGMFQQEERGLFFVSDGIGGHYAGEKASGEIKAVLSSWWHQYISMEKIDFQEAVDQIKGILADTHTQIQKETEENGICGATIVLLLVVGRQYALLWAGDSRCYHLEQRFLRIQSKQLTIDDTWENFMAEGYTVEEKKRHPFFGKLLRAVGVGGEFSYHLQTGEIRGKTLFTLCSDGVYKYVDPDKMDAEMKAALKKETFDDSMNYLRDMVYENHAPDNLSCVMVGVFE